MPDFHIYNNNLVQTIQLQDFYYQTKEYILIVLIDVLLLLILYHYDDWINSRLYDRKANLLHDYHEPKYRFIQDQTTSDQQMDLKLEFHIYDWVNGFDLMYECLEKDHHGHKEFSLFIFNIINIITINNGS